MEVSIFSREDIRAQKSKFVEARLHSDTKDKLLNKRIAELVETVAKTSAQPTYVTVDPASEKEFGRYTRAALTEGDVVEFIEFLKWSAAEL